MTTGGIRYAFTSQVAPEGGFVVARFTGEEGLSRLYRFAVDLIAEDQGTDPEDLLGEDATLTIEHQNGQRAIHGIVTHVETLAHVDGCAFARVILRPRVWNLTRTPAYAVHLDTTTPDVIRSALAAADLTEADYECELVDDYRVWPFRLQYGETHWDFLSRILERDGVYFHFEADGSHERIVFCDDRRAQSPLAEADLPFATALGTNAGDHGEVVHSLVSQGQHLPARVVVRNYNDERPSRSISAEETIDPKGSGTVDVFGENVLEQEEARQLATIRAEEIRCTRQTVHGASTAPRLAAGYQFRLGGHPREKLNREYLLLRVEHEGEDPEALRRVGEQAEQSVATYENRFVAMPADVQYRPPRETVKPRIHGNLNARIDAAGTSVFAEIDDEGRYHVVFPFDTAHEAGRASHWIRLVQPYAGEREGIHFPLRKGARVLIGFIGGDPDLPVISGTIPNTEQPSVTNADNLAKSNIRTASGNLVELDDENARIKLFSPTCRTYMHLGASNAPGDGVVSVTDGLAQWMSLGGISMVTTTQGWLVESEIWPLPTSDDRNIELNWYALNEAAARESESEWTIDDTLERVFRFPLKHKRPDSGDPNDSEDSGDLKYRPYHDELGMGEDEDYLDKKDELSNLVHTGRKIGEEYSYRSGTDFVFNGPQREAFTFGPLATMDSYSHDADPDDLRGALVQVLEKFDGNDGAREGLDDSDKGAYQQARIDYRIAREKRLRREALLIWHEPVELDNEGERSLCERFKAKADDNHALPVEPSARTATIRRVVAKAAESVLDDVEDLKDAVEDGLTDDEEEALTDGVIGFIYTSDVADRLNDEATIGATTPGDDFKSWFEQDLRPEEAEGDAVELDYDDEYGLRQEEGNGKEDYLVRLIVEHVKAQKAYNDAWEEVREAMDAELPDRLRQGRLSVTDLATISVHNGYTVSYTRGASYSEKDLRDSVDTVDLKDAVSFVEESRDLVAPKGPKFDQVESEVDAYDPDTGEFNGDFSYGKVAVDKTIGNTYSYQKGSSITVQEGNRESRNYQDNVVEKVFAMNGDKVFESEWKTDHVKQRVYNPSTGGLVSKEDVYWSSDGRRTHTERYQRRADATLNIAAIKSITLNLGIVANTNINVGSYTETTVSLINKNKIEVTGAIQVQAVFAPSGGVLDIKNTDYDWNGPGLAAKKRASEIDKAMVSVDSKIGEVKKSVSEVRKYAFSLHAGKCQVGPQGFVML